MGVFRGMGGGGGGGGGGGIGHEQQQNAAGIVVLLAENSFYRAVPCYDATSRAQYNCSPQEKL